jgi:hypothetical protein
MASATLRLLLVLAAGGILGSSWLLGDGLVGPGASFVLVALVAAQRGSLGRFIAALGYYISGSLPIVAAVVGYWGADHAALGVAAWLGASLLLSAPWAFAAGRWGALGALAVTALPPLGVIGWLSPLNSAGVLFPGLSWIGLGLLCFGIAAMYGPAHHPRVAPLATLALIVLVSNLIYREAAPSKGWTGVTTHLKPARGNVFDDVRNNQEAIHAGITRGKGERVVVFPEAILDDWWPGTRQQFALRVPAGQLWILGADTHSSDAVVAATRGRADEHVLARSAGLLLGGNWLPGSRQTLRPLWWERVFLVDQTRVWAALCVEQVQPWTWLEAMLQHPDVVLALSNGWWADTPAAASLPASEAGPAIERASSRAWTRLMHRPVVWAVNR